MAAPFVVSGDWNVSPELWDRHHPNTHEADFFARAREAGWVDIYRRFHDSEGRTWFRRTDQPYQLDHVFCDSTTATRVRSCEIEAYPAAVLSVSDHAPVVIEFT